MNEILAHKQQNSYHFWGAKISPHAWRAIIYGGTGGEYICE